MASVTAFLIFCQAATSANTSTHPRSNASTDAEFLRVLKAMIQVESGGDPEAVGDGGRAIGILQIHRGYWADATRFLGVSWPYSDAKDPVKAAAAVRAYCEHYARHYGRPWTAETISRIHNGGPRGWEKQATIRYYRKVQAAMSAS